MVLGPIVFALAVLAIVAVFAGVSSGNWLSGTSRETNNLYANQIIDFGDRVYTTVQYLLGSYSVPDYGWNPQHTGCGWTNMCTNTNCTIFCDNYVATSQYSTECTRELFLPSSVYTYPFNTFNIQAAGDIALLLISNVGTQGKGQIVLRVDGLPASLCKAINQQLGYGSISPTESGYGVANYQVTSNTITEPTGSTIGTTATQFAGQTSFCVGNGNFSNTQFTYYRVLVVR